MSSMPIEFIPESILSILRGEKTQTRRRVKETHRFDRDDNFIVTPEGVIDSNGELYRSPYGDVGDKLWVRESFRIDKLTYRVDNVIRRRKIWNSGQYMTRKMARIFLEITGIRMERLHAITEADAIAEGTTLAQFPALWKRAYKTEEAYNSNPLVWVYEFKRTCR